MRKIGFLVLACALLVRVSLAHADAVTQAAPVTVDLTGIAVAATGGFFSILGLVIAAWFQAHVKDRQAAATLEAAVNNSLGAMQQAATMGIRSTDLHLSLPASTPPLLAVGVQYAVDHAGDEAKRLGISNEMIADKINARVGLANIATNLATASSPLPSPRPLDPVPPAAQPAKPGA